MPERYSFVLPDPYADSPEGKLHIQANRRAYLENQLRLALHDDELHLLVEDVTDPNASPVAESTQDTEEAQKIAPKALRHTTE